MLHRMADAKSIGAADLRLLLVTNDIEEAVAHIGTNAIDAYGLGRREPRPSTILGESPGLPAPGRPPEWAYKREIRRLLRARGCSFPRRPALREPGVDSPTLLHVPARVVEQFLRDFGLRERQ